MDTFDFKMFIRYINKSFININTCDKYDASSSVNEQIKTFFYFNDGGGGGEKIQELLIFTTILGEKKYKKIFSRPFFFWGGGGRKEKDRVMRRNIVLTFLLKKTAVKMTGCLARFRSKGSLLICEMRNIDHVCVYHGISFIQK